jgi:hypothetical protein
MQTPVMIQEQLKAVIAKGKAPEFRVMDYHVHNGGNLEAGPSISVTLRLLLEGQEVTKTVSQQVCRVPGNGTSGFSGRLGTIDLVENAFREALSERWPKIGRLLEGFETPGYSVMAMGAHMGPCGNEHHVKVVMQVKNGQSHGGVVEEGVDTIQEVVRVYQTVFHWLAWRLLRRVRGQERARRK